MVEARLALENRGELHGRLSGCFARVEPRQQAGKYITGLMSDLPRKNCWALAEHAGDATPNRMQRLLNDAVWDTATAMSIVRRFVAEHLAPSAGGLAVAALDETGPEKKGSATAGVKRQYMGCAGQVANGINTVHCSYATRGGHALIGARLYLPAEQLDNRWQHSDRVLFREAWSAQDPSDVDRKAEALATMSVLREASRRAGAATLATFASVLSTSTVIADYRRQGPAGRPAPAATSTQNA